MYYQTPPSSSRQSQLEELQPQSKLSDSTANLKCNEHELLSLVRSKLCCMVSWYLIAILTRVQYTHAVYI